MTRILAVLLLAALLFTGCSAPIADADTVPNASEQSPNLPDAPEFVTDKEYSEADDSGTREGLYTGEWY
ncbi:MAG: hypothetical protein LBC38_04180, partial [Oscillospiraceae bacterium]|nr:hypothetical protein [Oscillospiraceae bacterium]